jgi:PmbA protein
LAGSPDADQLGSLSGDRKLYSSDVYSLPGEERINYARRAEKAAMDFDPRIKNSEGGSFDAATGRKILANSHGFVGEYRRSYCSVAAVPIAQTESGAMQRDYWYSVSAIWLSWNRRSKSASGCQRTLRRLGARRLRLRTCRLCLIRLCKLNPRAHFEGVNGDSSIGALRFAGK